MHASNDGPTQLGQHRPDSNLEASLTPYQHPQLPMVGWYDPSQLLKTAAQVVASTAFGGQYDYRFVEALATPTADQNFDDFAAEVADEESFWFDYAADLGDGWNPTYAIARTLAATTLAFDANGIKLETCRGRVLIFGGDEVYPTPSRRAYRQRLVAPYETALPNPVQMYLSLYAIPGNHDWYDSLISFTRQFVGRARFGQWVTRQVRSYFAIRLPRGWWLCGLDVQLASDIDDRQVDYFRKASKTMNDGDRIILCNAEPHWVYSEMYNRWDPDINESNLTFLEKDVFQNQRIVVFLAGDLHHYRRHATDDGKQKITAGGGGAFLHPTHGPKVGVLKDGYKLRESYPTEAVSKRLCWRNLVFLFLNPRFGMLTAALYTATAWAGSTDLSGYGLGEFAAASLAVIKTVLGDAFAGTWLAIVLLGFWLFTDTHSPRYRLFGSLLHAVGHLTCVFGLGWVACEITNSVGLPRNDILASVVAGFVVAAGGWLVGSFVLGLYLLISLNVFGRHFNEAFSSLQIQDWKNFLRMKIDPDGSLTIYPIGIERVPRRWKANTTGSGPLLVPDDPRATHPILIEPPIVIPKQASFTTR